MSVVSESDLLHLVSIGVLPPKELCSWRICRGVTLPTEDTHESVIYVPFLIRRLALPISLFFRGLLDFYCCPRKRAVAKCRVSEVDGGRLRVGRAGKQELLSSPALASVGEGELRSLFEGEELRIMLFNYREMGIIPKVESM
jgi:hypothetical protein